MSRLTIMSSRTSPQVTRDLYADLERRIFDDSADFCPVDMTVSFLMRRHAGNALRAGSDWGSFRHC